MPVLFALVKSFRTTIDGSQAPSSFLYLLHVSSLINSPHLRAEPIVLTTWVSIARLLASCLKLGSWPNGIKLGGNHDFFDGFTLILELSSLSCMYGYQNPHRRGGHQMVPTSTTILQRFSGEWAARLQPEAILTVGREIG
jgi:hypothetical protein